MQPNSMQPTAAPSAPVTPIAAPKQKNMGLIAGMVMSILLGIGGISFGVYGMINASNKTTDISDLNIQYTTKEGESVKIDTDKIEISDDKKTIKIDESNVKKTNPIINSTATERYGISYNTSFYASDGTPKSIRIYVNNGVISNCDVYAVEPASTHLKECKINGISGKIYKIATIHEGHDADDDSVAFILEDGTVDYLPLNGVFESSSEETIKGKVNISGFVTDIFWIGVSSTDPEAIGGGTSSVFVLSNGTFVKYDKATMLQ